MSKATALAVQTIFRGVVIDARHLAGRWGHKRHRLRGQDPSAYVIGSGADAQGPVAAAYIDGPSLALAEPGDDGFVINVTARMTGQIDDNGVVTPLATWVARHGTRFAVPATGQAQIVCGQTTFVIAATSPAAVLPRPWFHGHGPWRWEQQRYTVWSGLALLLIVLLASLVPPDARTLSFERIPAQLRLADFVVAPPESKVMPKLRTGAGASPGAASKAAPGPAGAMGDKAARTRDRRNTLQGPPDTAVPRPAQQRVDEIKTAGILGLLRPEAGSPLASILGDKTAVGQDSDSILGDLIASRTGDAYGTGGLDMLGTGAGGAYVDSLIGTDRLDTMDTRGTRGGGRLAGFGPRGGADLGTRKTKVPDYFGGAAVVRGALDKEIVRRIIRRHINEVKYCYETELARHNNLEGRIAVNFTIAATGQVAAAVVQTSTMKNARVESCLVGAVRRWEFPKPMGGGLVIATYPFTFMAAGAETP